MRNKKIEEYAHILFFFSIIGAIGIILSAVEKPNLKILGMPSIGRSDANEER